MQNIFFITLPTVGNGNSKVPYINQETWNKFISDVQQLINPDYLPYNLQLFCYKHKGTPIVDSNVVSISPNEDYGSDLIIKRNGSKILLKIKTKNKEYETIVSAILLSLKKYVTNVIITNKLQWDGIKLGIDYYQYVFETNAPIIHPKQAGQIIIQFKWLENIPEEDCQATLDDIKSLLNGNADDISIRFK